MIYVARFKTMAKHHPDLIFCRKQAGVGKLFCVLDYSLSK